VTAYTARAYVSIEQTNCSTQLYHLSPSLKKGIKNMRSKFPNIRPNLAGDFPQIHPTSLIDPSAQIIGNVIVEKNVFIAPLTVIRADDRGPDGRVAPITICEDVNIQDGVIIHSHGGQVVTIGARSTVAHGAVIHGPCVIAEDCFLALRTILYNTTLEKAVWVGIGSLVKDATISAFSYIPPNSLIRVESDVWKLGLVSEKEQQYMKEVHEATRRLRDDYMRSRCS
jgi:carbonic anhydrase/acetyltransferase-like protein (isoleucine patch superfamily)